MTRTELEAASLDALNSGNPLFLRMHGSPDCRRMRLIGQKKGPYGIIVDWIGCDVIVQFNADVVTEYLNNLPTSVLGGSDYVSAVLAIINKE